MSALNFLLYFWAIVPAASPQSATHDSGRTVPATRAQGRIAIDGRLDEPSWSLAAPSNGFLQRDPNEGQAATEDTELRALYDDAALYVGVRLLDGEAGKIVRRLSRRDTSSDADRFTLYLDPHHDHLNGAMFEVSAGNVQRDAAISNDENQDDSWDSVWESGASVDERGWFVELRIPFSQLRFPRADHHVFGVNAQRFIQRKNESSWLQLTPKSESGLASRMAHLTGIDGIGGGRHLEVTPYSVVRQEFVAPSSSQNPFNDGARLFTGFGVDLKYGLTSNFTLDATINPDFGQVEVDPAVINLGEFETTFPEKRPFFLEGSQIFGNFGRGGANNFYGFNRSEPTIFYSRRIGRPPQGETSSTFVDRTAATTILGAAKLTGRTRGGWTTGLLEAVTGRESAKLDNGGTRSEVEIEPLTNYFVGRIQKDVGRRGGFGAIATSVRREPRAKILDDLLPRTAHVVGGDGYLFFDDKREWVATASLSRSWVTGSTSSIDRLQRSPQRYYQRPDAPHVRLDPTATSLKGWAGSINLNRNSGKYWTFNTALWGTSPGFDSNGVGLMFAGDVWGAHAALNVRKLDPDRWTRSRWLILAKSFTRNFNDQTLSDAFFVFGNATLLNYWNLGASVGLFRRTLDDRRTRGGPIATSPAAGFSNFDLGTDGRKRLSASVSMSRSWDEFGDGDTGGQLTVTVKPAASLTISTGPNIRRSYNSAQYVRSVVDPTAQATFGARYVFSDLDQKQISMVSRVSWIASPRMSLQVYAQPFIAVGDYRSLKEFSTPGTFDFRRYGTGASLLDYSATNRSYTIDPDSDGPASSFALDDPDFNFKSHRVNAIFRWEWRLGSTLYLVWTENRVDVSNPGRLSLKRDAGRLFAAPGDDIFLAKFAYWFGK